MNKPNMIPEIIEAIHLMYEDYPNIESDCYLCLTSLCYGNGVANESVARFFAQAGIKALEDMDRCPHCGELLEVRKYDELHPELDGNVVEHLFEYYCPNCDRGWN